MIQFNTNSAQFGCHMSTNHTNFRPCPPTVDEKLQALRAEIANTYVPYRLNTIEQSETFSDNYYVYVDANGHNKKMLLSDISGSAFTINIEAQSGSFTPEQLEEVKKHAQSMHIRKDGFEYLLNCLSPDLAVYQATDYSTGADYTVSINLNTGAYLSATYSHIATNEQAGFVKGSVGDNKSSVDPNGELVVNILDTTKLQGEISIDAGGAPIEE